MQAVDLSVIGRVAHNENLRRIHDARHAVQEARRAHAAGQRDDHFPRPVIRRPECFTLWRMLSAINSAAALSMRRAFSSGPQSMALAPGSMATSSVTAA